MKTKTKMQNTTNFQHNAFGHAGWKYYNSIKKKAMEQEFSWSGLIISLSIAFFIVIACALILSIMYESISRAKNHEKFIQQKVYYLENVNHINIQAMINNKTDFTKINLNKLSV